MKSCPEPHCFAPASTCALGESKLQDCPRWKNGKGNPDSEETRVHATDVLPLPWSGNTFGRVDVPFVAARSKPKVVAIAGPHNAGKTTLLAAWYLIAGKGHARNLGCFAGSYTLEGWENLAHSLRWTETSGPIFPMHTPTAGRFPGLLHWALRTDCDVVLDLLLADAPGEWFRRWAIDRNAEDAAGARWLADYADVFIVLADCDALSSPLRGSARNSLELLLDRVGAERKNRPVALVWSKADKEVPNEIREAVQQAARLNMPDITEFDVSVYPEDNLENTRNRYLSVFSWAITRSQASFQIKRTTQSEIDPFMVYGR